MGYCHTQRSPVRYFLYPWLGLLVLFAWVLADQPLAVLVVCAIALTGAFVFSCFATLTVSDQGDHLAVRFGPIPLFFTKIAYRQIARAEADRSSIIDGWGIHWLPWRGATYNLWGFDCVKLQVGRRTIRIGSDDARNLAAFLRWKIAENHAAEDLA